MIKLRPYQQEAARAIMDSVMERRGLTFSVEIARQGGKNELSAQLEVLILTLFMSKGGNSIKCSPTFKPQTVISMMRLKERLDEWGYAGFWESEMGYIIKLGSAAQIFLSADESASVVGNTAHNLLEIDESQDVSKEKYSKDFVPMGATTNVTIVHYGTTWDDLTLLEEIKQSNLELAKKDGIKRHFRYDWQEVAKYNPEYLAYVEAERERLGENHPLFLTQYCLMPIRGGGRFLSPQQRAQLQGEHARLHAPPSLRAKRGNLYVAGIDLAGEAEEDKETMLTSPIQKRDSTVITICEIQPPTPDDVVKVPRLMVREHYQWKGIKHTDLYPRMVDLLKNTWNCSRIVVDATGIGEPVASFLKKAMGSRVKPFTFSQRSKSELGFGLLAAINGGRLKMYAGDSSEEAKEFWWEMEKAKSSYRASQTMNFYVDESEGHDDFLMSLALAVEAVSDYQPRVARGRGMSPPPRQENLSNTSLSLDGRGQVRV
jgi:hypothetical protein